MDKRELKKWRVAEHRRKTKLKAIAYKGGKCEKCGYSKYPQAMVFHHTDPNSKDFAIGQDGVARSWERIMGELDKTTLVCANCHAEIHHEWNEKENVLAYEKMRELVPARASKSFTHGNSGYVLGCRCQECLDGRALESRRYKYRTKLAKERNCPLSDIPMDVELPEKRKVISAEELPWPSDSELLLEVQEGSVGLTAFRLGYTYKQVWTRVQRIKAGSNG